MHRKNQYDIFKILSPKILNFYYINILSPKYLLKRSDKNLSATVNGFSRSIVFYDKGHTKNTWTVEGVSQMTILLHKPYLVKVTTQGRGSKIPKNLTTWFMDDP